MSGLKITQTRPTWKLQTLTFVAKTCVSKFMAGVKIHDEREPKRRNVLSQPICSGQGTRQIAVK